MFIFPKNIMKKEMASGDI